MCVDECLHVQRVFVGVCGCVGERERDSARRMGMYVRQ